MLGRDPLPYHAVKAPSLRERAVLSSLACGNPTALAELKAGEVVLDLGNVGVTCC